MTRMSTRKFLLLLLLIVPASQAQRRVLVYTRSYTSDGKGYVHGNIAASVASIQKIGASDHFAVDVSDDPAVFTPANLQRYGVLVFSNSNNEAFSNDAQRAAFKSYIQHGGGWVGIHSASGSERSWDWFAEMVGARFISHPKQQDFTVRVVDPSFPAVKGVPLEFKVNDECYFTKLFRDDLHVVLDTDRTKLDLTEYKTDVTAFPNPLPLAWWHEFDGGREFYLALGHDPSNYSDPMYTGIVERAILWAMQKP